MVPVSVVAQAAGMASYPFMAELFVKNDLSRFNRTINSALQNVLTLLVPLSIWMILVAEPTIRLIFQQGRFGVSDTAHTARLLQVLLICVSCWGYQQVLSRAFYARLDTLTPAVLGTVRNVAHDPGLLFADGSDRRPGSSRRERRFLFFYSAAMTFWWKSRSGGAVFSGLLPGTGQSCRPVRDLVLPAWAAGKANPFDPAIFALTWPPFAKSF